jgi:transcriptional regulator with XRE-family HTH domain
VRVSQGSAGAQGSVPFDPGLEQAMRGAGLSYRALAERTGLSAGYLNHLAHGNRPVPSDDVIERIAEALGLSPDHFLEYRIRAIAGVLRREHETADRIYEELCVREVATSRPLLL